MLIRVSAHGEGVDHNRQSKLDSALEGVICDLSVLAVTNVVQELCNMKYVTAETVKKTMPPLRE